MADTFPPDPLPGIRHEMVETLRLRQHVYFSGSSGGIPIIFLHGNFSAALYWEEIMQALPTAYWGIAPDLRGYGWTEDKPIDARRSLRDWSDDIAALMDRLGLDNAHFVGWSLGGGILYRCITEYPKRIRSATLICPVPPYGMGGTKDVSGTPYYDDFAGSGGGSVEPNFVAAIERGDRSADPKMPRDVIRQLYFKPPFRAAREEDFLTASLMEKTGKNAYPGDSPPSPHWPFFAPGDLGPINSISPKHLCELERDLLALDGKPPILWIRGSDDKIVSDDALTDWAVLGKLGLKPGWPGDADFPPQPMIGQTRAVLEHYAARGGHFREYLSVNAAHSPHIENPREFVSLLVQFLEHPQQVVQGTLPEPPYHPAAPIQAFLDQINAADGPGNDLDRMTSASVPGLWLIRELAARNTIEEIPVGSVRDLAIPARNHQIPIRIYMPRETNPEAERKLPILIFLHGGGWCLGSIATYDSVARMMANAIPAQVVSVDYRLAPEHPFPACLEDVRLAVEWVARNAEKTNSNLPKLILAGDSGGGTLATVTAIKAKGDGISIALQVLFYPSTNISRTNSLSYGQYGEGHRLTRKAVEDFRRFSLPNPADWQRPEVSPLLTKPEELRKMPPALVIVAGCDPLREEGLAYFEQLQANGVPVVHRVKEAMIHGFLAFFNAGLYPEISPLVETILHEAVVDIRKMLADADQSN